MSPFLSFHIISYHLVCFFFFFVFVQFYYWNWIGRTRAAMYVYCTRDIYIRDTGPVKYSERVRVSRTHFNWTIWYNIIYYFFFNTYNFSYCRNYMYTKKKKVFIFVWAIFVVNRSVCWINRSVLVKSEKSSSPQSGTIYLRLCARRNETG